MAWRGPEGGEPVDEVVVLATALHDLGWQQLDEVPRWNPASGRPYDFREFPPDQRYRSVGEGIDRVEDLHPYAAVLVSLHYATLGSPSRPLEFDEEEEIRRMELLEKLGDDAPGPRRIRADLDLLRLFDNLSLFICLKPPGASPDAQPDWLTPEILGIPGAAGSRDRESSPRIHLEWRDEETVALDPFPFGSAPLLLDLPFRDLPDSRFPGQESLDHAWKRAEEESARIRVVQSSLVE